MSKKKSNKYWETEEGETVEFGKLFMRCFDKAGKLQFGSFIENKSDKTKTYFVKFTLDKQELINSEEGAEFLVQTIEDWRNELDE